MTRYHLAFLPIVTLFAANIYAATYSTTVTQKSGTQSQISSATLAKGELAIATDTGVLFAQKAAGGNESRARYYPGGSAVSSVFGRTGAITATTGDYTAAQVGAVPTTRTVNGQSLSDNITLAAADVGAVPTTRTVNGQSLSDNITLTAANVGAETSGAVATHAALTSGVHGLRPSTFSNISTHASAIPSGGTTGQKLIKNSNTSYDTRWETDTDLALSDTTPAMSTTSGTAGVGTTASRGDHAHPSDTSRLTVARFSTYSASRQAQFGTVLPLSGGTLTGNVLVKPGTNSTTAFQVQKSDATNVLAVDTTNGKVGIGTDAPTQQLDVNGTIKSTGRYFLNADGSASTPALYRTTGVGVMFPGSTELSLITGSADRLRVSATGNLGLGVTAFDSSAAKSLYIANGTAPAAHSTSDSVVWSESTGLKIMPSGSTGTVTLGNNTLIAADSATTGNLLDVKLGASSKFSVPYTGPATLAASLSLSGHVYFSSAAGGSLYSAQTANTAGTNVNLYWLSAKTNTTGSSNCLSLTPTYNQASGTASNTDLLINRTETAVGSGTQRLISAGTGGGTYTEKFGVSNTGNVIFAVSSSPAAADACTAGTITWDASYIYVCTASGAWKRSALTGGY